MKLAIKIKSGAENVLVGYPLRDGEYHDDSDTETMDDCEIIYVTMDDYTDTTARQEQHLNTNPDVISYEIV
jgi:hypothetical protein